MTTRWLITALLAACAAAQAQEPKEPVEVLRQRLSDRLATPGDGTAAATSRRSPRASAKPAKAVPPKPVRWGYTGDIGPDRWAELAPENRLCGIGTRQSPIDIRDGLAVDLEPIGFDYGPSAFSVLDNGHTIQVSVAPGNSLTVMGKRYELVDFHFHRPSEERVGGQQFDMVAHLMHRDDKGQQAVVAVLLERGGDAVPHPLIQTVWAHLPLERGDVLKGQSPLDMSLVLPADRGYFTFMGSLTEPPCTEGVLWMVMRQPLALTAQQIDVFSRLYPMNARPLQAGSGRLIKQSH
jgi:carbonic anhydrase